MQTPLPFLQPYSPALQDRVRQLQVQGKLGDYIVERYAQQHLIQTDKAL